MRGWGPSWLSLRKQGLENGVWSKVWGQKWAVSAPHHPQGVVTNECEKVCWNCVIGGSWLFDWRQRDHGTSLFASKTRKPSSQPPQRKAGRANSPNPEIAMSLGSAFDFIIHGQVTGPMRTLGPLYELLRSN